VGGAGAAIQIVEGSAAVGVELFPCWYDSDSNLGLVLGLCDVDIRSQRHVLFLAGIQDFDYAVLVVICS
jgi:hypothetical protein